MSAQHDSDLPITSDAGEVQRRGVSYPETQTVENHHQTCLLSLLSASSSTPYRSCWTEPTTPALGNKLVHVHKDLAARIVKYWNTLNSQQEEMAIYM